MYIYTYIYTHRKMWERESARACVRAWEVLEHFSHVIGCRVHGSPSPVTQMNESPCVCEMTDIFVNNSCVCTCDVQLSHVIGCRTYRPHESCHTHEWVTMCMWNDWRICKCDVQFALVDAIEPQCWVQDTSTPRVVSHTWIAHHVYMWRLTWLMCW